ncbi:hypothetical protein HZA97_09300 [Candidatus Woesearchaeota archaeon]|nr:hypothetical protein [Candidatus Woesearchaeota archaeon]
MQLHKGLARIPRPLGRGGGHFIRFINFNLSVIFPLIEVGLSLALIYYVFLKRKIRNKKIMLFFALIFGLILYLTPHVFTYYAVKDALKVYYGGVENVELSVVDYVKIRASLGVTVKRALSKSQEWGSFGFYLFEVIDFFLLVGGIVYGMFVIAKKPFSERHQKFYTETVIKKNVPVFLVKQLKAHIKKEPNFSNVINILRDSFEKYRNLPNKKAKTLEIIAPLEKDEFAVDVFDDYYILTQSEITQLKKIL